MKAKGTENTKNIDGIKLEKRRNPKENIENINSFHHRDNYVDTEIRAQDRSRSDPLI